MFTVLGITGQVGGATARHLLAAGKQVRAVVRDRAKASSWSAQGVELVQGDVSDKQSLADAFSGSEGAFVMTPPYMHVQNPLAENRVAVTAIVEAAHMSGIAKLVFLSSIGSQHSSGTGAILKTHELEQQLRKLGMPVAAIRAASFFENFRNAVEPAKTQGILPTFAGNASTPVPMVATEDIGALAARLLTEYWPGKRILELEGPRRYSADDVAKDFSAALGKPVRAVLIPAEKQQGILESAGLTPSAANSLIEMYDAANAGRLQFEGSPAEHVQGATELSTVVRELLKRD